MIKHRYVLGALAVTALIAATGADKSGCSSTGSSANSTNSPAAPDNTTSAAATTPAHAPVVLLDVHGTGTKTTQKFSAASDWDLAWSYDCTGFSGGTGNFQVYIYNGDGSLGDIATNELGAKGSDVTHEHQGGTFYLTVNSECVWTIRVTG